MPSESVIKRRILQHYVLLRRGLILSVVVGLLAIVLIFFLPLFRLGKEVLFGPVNVFSVVFQRPSELKSDAGQTNILLLGIGGPEHDGPNLTDTMIVASFKLPIDDKTASATPAVNLISLPRDIYLDSLGGKINTAYAVGFEKGPDVGLVMAKATVSEVTGLPIHYVVVVDFSVFEKIVDIVGGVDVTVEREFTDKEYPLDGKENDQCGGDPEFKCRYETIQFSAGFQHMDGATALKFVRSRHADGDEGTDFARAKRQQLVLAALKAKLFSGNLLLSPSRILEIYNQLKTHINTDLSPNEANQIINVALKFRQAQFKNVVLGLDQLENPPIDDRGWILTPKGGDWSVVHDFVKSTLQE
ncbi:LCP family protein [Candidatus Microgenomates bacterium]|nr:LCP family protein [Candidatus Microgenomates bacterium]